MKTITRKNVTQYYRGATHSENSNGQGFQYNVGYEANTYTSILGLKCHVIARDRSVEYYPIRS